MQKACEPQEQNVSRKP